MLRAFALLPLLATVLQLAVFFTPLAGASGFQCEKLISDSQNDDDAHYTRVQDAFGPLYEDYAGVRGVNYTKNAIVCYDDSTDSKEAVSFMSWNPTERKFYFSGSKVTNQNLIATGMPMVLQKHSDKCAELVKLMMDELPKGHVLSMKLEPKYHCYHAFLQEASSRGFQTNEMLSFP